MEGNLIKEIIWEGDNAGESAWDKQKRENIRALEKLKNDITYAAPKLEKLLSEVPSLPKVKTSETMHLYESARSFVQRIKHQVEQWALQCPKDAQLVILAILDNGIAVDVRVLSEEGFQGINIIGTLSGSDTECMVICNQATLQLVCFMKKLEEHEEMRKIGFVLHDEKEEIT